MLMMNMYMYMYMLKFDCKPDQTALCVLCCFALFVCLTLLASFFLPSHLSFKNMYMVMLKGYGNVPLCPVSCVCHSSQVSGLSDSPPPPATLLNQTDSRRTALQCGP